MVIACNFRRYQSDDVMMYVDALRTHFREAWLPGYCETEKD